jgi:hypothetical protein
LPGVSPTASVPLALVLVEPVRDHSAAEVVRQEYLGYEVSIRLFGSLHCLAGFGLLMGIGLWLLALWGHRGALAQFLAIEWIVLAFGMAVAVFLIALGSGLRRLRPWAWWVEVVLILVILSFGAAETIVIAVMRSQVSSRVFAPVTVVVLLVLIPILSLLLSAGGTMVFSPAYEEVRTLTGSIRHRAGALSCSVAAVVIAMIVGALALLAPALGL